MMKDSKDKSLYLCKRETVKSETTFILEVCSCWI